MSERDEFEAWFASRFPWPRRSVADWTYQVALEAWQAARDAQTVPALTDEQIYEIERRCYVNGRRPIEKINGFTGEEETVWEDCKHFSLLTFARAIIRSSAAPQPSQEKTK